MCSQRIPRVLRVNVGHLLALHTVVNRDYE